MADPPSIMSFPFFIFNIPESKFGLGLELAYELGLDLWLDNSNSWFVTWFELGNFISPFGPSIIFPKSDIELGFELFSELEHDL